MGFNPFIAPDHVVIEKCARLPVMRIRPAGVRSGPADPGGWLWLIWIGVGILPLLMRRIGNKRNCC
jgi:hypothetical protein